MDTYIYMVTTVQYMQYSTLHFVMVITVCSRAITVHAVGLFPLKRALGPPPDLLVDSQERKIG